MLDQLSDAGHWTTGSSVRGKAGSSDIPSRGRASFAPHGALNPKQLEPCDLCPITRLYVPHTVPLQLTNVKDIFNYAIFARLLRTEVYDTTRLQADAEHRRTR